MSIANTRAENVTRFCDFCSRYRVIESVGNVQSNSLILVRITSANSLALIEGKERVCCFM
ncbi:hypothetical protein CBM2637_A60073 [Cupriavidus taiwanensis]|nr:hypothetical protein CBM2637_A60073 [Cupriavidus taiwanensis]